MNSALLLALNAIALTALVTFHFQPTNTEDTAQLNQPVPHHLQQRPQLAVLNASPESPTRVAQDTRTAPTSEHWVF